MWVSALSRRVVGLPLGVHPVHPALSAGRDQQLTRAIEGQRPDVLLLGIEEGRSLPGRVHGVHLAVGRGPHEEAPVGAHRQRVDLELGGVEEGRSLA